MISAIIISAKLNARRVSRCGRPRGPQPPAQIAVLVSALRLEQNAMERPRS